MLNKVILQGRLTKDPELRYTPNTNTAVARYSLAVDRPKQGDKKETDFINVVVWGKQAETAANYLKKGRMINIVGRLQTNKWTDKDGQNRSAMEVIVEEQHFIGSNNGSNEGGNNNNTMFNGVNDDDLSLADVDEKDLPF